MVEEQGGGGATKAQEAHALLKMSRLYIFVVFLSFNN